METRTSFLITAVENEEGQSIIELCLALPIMIALSFILIRISTVIQMGIVNQQYARAQALFLTFNSPYYPELRFRHGPGGMVEKGEDIMLVGVSENIQDEEGSGYEPMKYKISRDGAKRAPASDPNQKDEVHVYNTVALCTQRNFVQRQVENNSHSLSENYMKGFTFCGGLR